MSDLNKKFEESSNQVFIYKPKKASDKRRFGDSVVQGVSNYTFPKPAPTIGISSEIIMDKSDNSNYTQGTASDEVARKDTITFTGYFIPPMTVDANGCKIPSIAPGPATTQWIFSQQRALRAAVLQKFVTIEVNDKNGAMLDSFANCNVTSIDFPEGNNAQYGEYTLTFESFNTDNMGDNHIEYSYEFSVSEDSSMGYFHSSMLYPVTMAHLTGTESITVSALDVLDAKRFIEAKRKFHGGSIVYLTSGFNTLDLEENGNEYKPANITYNTTVNPTDGSVTYSSTFILVPQFGSYSDQVMGTLSYTMDVQTEDDVLSGTVAGNITGIRIGFSTTASENSDRAIDCYNALYAENPARLRGVFPALATVDDRPFTESVTRNMGQSTVDFTLEFTELGPEDNFQVPNVSAENVSITYNPQRRLFAQIPVIGREAGPILQDGNSTTERTKEFTIEVTYLPGFGDESGPGTQDIEDQHRPTGTSILFETAASTTWNSYERTFTRSKTWVYEY